MTINTVVDATENQFISDLGLKFEYYLTHLSAPTGSGKSTIFLEELSQSRKVIFVCAVNVQVAQIAADYQDNANVHCITKDNLQESLNARVIVCVYDKLSMVLAQLNKPEDYVLVIDEAHKVYQAAGYRQAALTGIIDAIDNETFDQVITVSATFIPDIFPMEFDEIITINRPLSNRPYIDVVFYNKRESMQEELISITPKQGQVNIIRINDKERLKHAKCCFELRGLRVLEVHSDNQRSDEVSALLSSSKIANYDIVLTTSLLDEAINIKDENISEVHIFHRSHVDELTQFVGRCRKSTPHVTLHLSNSELERRKIDMDEERAEIEAVNLTALNYARLIGKKSGNYTRIVKQINATIKDTYRYEPLHYDYQTGEPPCVDKVSVLAKLYEVAMQAQYVNDQTLNCALLASGTFDQVNIVQAPSEQCAESQALMSEADDELALLKANAINDCLAELNCADGDVSHLTVDDVQIVEECHQQSSLVGEIAKSWKNLCFILPTNQALDVIQQNREKEVWAFHHVVTKRLDYLPFFLKIKSDLAKIGQIELVGADKIKRYFVDALSQYSEANPKYKSFVRGLKRTKVGVKANNHFYLDNRFIYQFIRNNTVYIERRSGGVTRFTITSLGLFGYDYRIRELQTVTAPRPKRKVVPVK